MSVNLQKGQKVELTKGNAGLNRLIVGLGWDEVEQKKKGGFGGMFAAPPPPIDCDASAILVGADGKLQDKRVVIAQNTLNHDVVFFKNLTHMSGSVLHKGDNLTGAGDGDDEQIEVILSMVPPHIHRIAFVVNIYDAVKRGQHFGMIQNAFIRIVNAANGQELCRYNLSDNYPGMTAMIFGEVYRYNGEWKFSAIGQATQDTGIVQTVSRYV
jgi:stress response protein SCP2